MNEEMYQQDEEEEGDPRKSPLNIATEHFYKLYNNWPSSRIIRVSRASGGKDRHSKVLTSKGLRDRRVRLSVTTAIQFYDLQDRLGYDQPSKAFEWLLNAASSSIDELPPISSPFFLDPPPPPKQNHQVIANDEKSSSRSDNNNSAAAENNGVIKGCSGLSLSRSEVRVRARERAKERALRTEVKEEKKKKDVNGGGRSSEYLQMNPNSHVSPRTTSFIELLNGGMSNDVVVGDNQSQNRQWNHYFTQNENSMEIHQHLLPSTFALPVVNGSCNENNLINFAISSSSGVNSSSVGLGGFDRGTLQSNSFSLSSESFLSQLPQRFNPHHHQDGFFFSSSSSVPPPPVENSHHQQFHVSGFDDARLQLCYGNDDHKVKGKN